MLDPFISTRIRPYSPYPLTFLSLFSSRYSFQCLLLSQCKGHLIKDSADSDLLKRLQQELGLRESNAEHKAYFRYILNGIRNPSVARQKQISKTNWLFFLRVVQHLKSTIAISVLEESSDSRPPFDVQSSNRACQGCCSPRDCWQPYNEKWSASLCGRCGEVQRERCFVGRRSLRSSRLS